MTALPAIRGEVIFLAGPTAVGKSALAVDLAQRWGAEIVGADAFQVYAGIPILTAQPLPAERGGIPHHLIGDVPLADPFDAQRYAAMASAALAAIAARGKPALVVGGTGLYFRALVDGLAPTPAPDPALRAELEAWDLDALVTRLAAADPEAPAAVDCRNKRRVLRAIEIIELSGRPLRDFRSTPRQDARGLVLTRDREDLRRRISHNVTRMFELGVVDEVRAARPIASSTARRAIGFAEIEELLTGGLTEAECVEKITIATRQYAKRQLTWFRHQTTFQTLDLTGINNPTLAAESALRTLPFA